MRLTVGFYFVNSCSLLRYTAYSIDLEVKTQSTRLCSVYSMGVKTHPGPQAGFGPQELLSSQICRASSNCGIVCVWAAVSARFNFSSSSGLGSNAGVVT